MLELTLSDHIALEASGDIGGQCGVHSARGNSRSDEGSRRAGTVEVQGANAGLERSAERIGRGGCDRKTGVKTSLVSDEREEQVRGALSDRETVDRCRRLNEARNRRSGR